MDGELRAYLDAMRGEVRDQLDRLRSEFGELRVEVMSRMDRLQDAVTSIRDDIAVNSRNSRCEFVGTADYVRRANDNTRDELRALSEVQTAMLKQIQRLQSDVRTLKGDA